jgi:NAD(P)-dependent dehydrogenase (short-subunit alcohol dehydrogenase family)
LSKRIIVTGAAGSLGRSVVAALGAKGLKIVGIDLSETGPDGEFVGGVDLTDPAQVRAAVEQIAANGPIDGLANIAGGFVWETVGESAAATWERMFRMNTLTALNACSTVIPFLGAGTSIVNVGAAAAAKAAAGMGAYAASKSGVARLTESLAEELKAEGVRVNAVLPSIIDTPANRADMGEQDAAKWVSPYELAEVIAFLLSDSASGVTGACIPVMGRV